MSAPAELFSVTPKEVKKVEEEDPTKKTVSSMPSREANRYARIPGGTGLPQTAAEAEADADAEADSALDDALDDAVGPAAPAKPKPKEKIVVGDGGAAWRARQLLRMQERAKREGTSLHEEAAERYGSVEDMRREVTERKRISNSAPGGRLSRRPAQFDGSGEDAGKPGGQAFDPAKRRREALEGKAGAVGPRAGRLLADLDPCTPCSFFLL